MSTEHIQESETRGGMVAAGIVLVGFILTTLAVIIGLIIWIGSETPKRKPYRGEVLVENVS